MSQSSPHLISARAIEDIIQVQKISDRLPKVIESEIIKDKIEDVDHLFNKLTPGCTFAENHICLPKVIEGNVKQNDIKFRKRIDGNGSEGDHQNTELKLDVKLVDKTDSELELKSWPSDSDITVIRMRKDFRNELSTRVTWEEERNLTDSNSSVDFDWESQSLINLANITIKEKDDAERLTPFTIWSKAVCHEESNELNPNLDLLGKGPLFTSISLVNKQKNILYCPSNELAFYVPVLSQDGPTSDETFCRQLSDMVPFLNENVRMLYETESSSTVNAKSDAERTGVMADCSQSGNKVAHTGKLKLLRSFVNFFSKCGSRKSASDNSD